MSRTGFAVVVHVLLLRDAQIFLLRRAGTGLLDGCYVPPGGHRRAAETATEAARRECTEEVGVRGLELQPVCVLTYAGGVNVVFEATRWRGEPVNAEPGRCDHAGWHALSALPTPPAPWLAQALTMREQRVWFAELS